MNIIIKTAWKNVWRNKVRSLVVIASVTIGIFAGVFAVAFMNGMMAQRFDAAFNYELSHIHINGKNFSLNNDPGITISDITVTDSALLSVRGVERISRRTVLTGMAATASKNAGVQIVGIDPEQEKKILRIHETLLPGSGNFFEAGSETGIAVIGRDLAKELNIIRYAIDTTAIRKLQESGVPATVTDKLTGLQGKRFPGEKALSGRSKSFLIPKKTLFMVL
jgi:ABC-type lipoprotein release transport system permease subunit